MTMTTMTTRTADRSFNLRGHSFVLTRPRAAGRKHAGAFFETALLLTLMSVVVVTGIYTARVGVGYVRAEEMAEAAARYATRGSVALQGRVGRPSAEDVSAYVRGVAGPGYQVSVRPDPRSARSGSLITVTLTKRYGAGALGRAANGIAAILHLGAPFPNDAITVSSTVSLRMD